MLKIVYLAHSGFAILTEKATLVVDYYSDSCVGNRCFSHGVVDDDLFSRPGRFYVLSTHGHADHFNPVILSWRESAGMSSIYFPRISSNPAWRARKTPFF